MSARGIVTQWMAHLAQAGYLVAKKIPSQRGPLVVLADPSEIERQLDRFQPEAPAEAQASAPAPEPERYYVWKNGMFLTPKGTWSRDADQAKTWVRRQLAHDRAAFMGGKVIPASELESTKGYEVTCPKCGERILDVDGDLLNCPVCDSDLSWP